MNSAAVYLVLLLATVPAAAQIANPYRTVMDSEIGSMFDRPNGFPYSDFGAYMGAGPYSISLNPDAIKGKYAHFHHFGPSDVPLGFPYSALRQYEAREIAAGRPRIFITATYQGKKRPVIDRGSLQLDSENRPTSSPQNWVYPVNVQDQRFIRFWVNQYVRPVILEPMRGLKNAWVYVDGCTYIYSVYGVLDDSNRFVPSVTWDEPFPQNGSEYVTSIETFFKTLAQIAPDINTNTDLGSIPDSGQFPAVYANIPGATAEDVYYQWHKNTTNPNLFTVWYHGPMSWYSWLAAHGRAVVMGAFVPEREGEAALRTGFVFYELLKGPNFFFAPRAVQCPAPVCPQEPPASEWLGWKAKLGNPVSTFQSSPPELGGGDGNRLFWRQYSTGYVYLNWTGLTKTITLPGGKWVDASNNAVTKLQIPNRTGTFISAAGEPETAAEPSISPRSPHILIGPVTVTVENNTAGAIIRYTVNGTTPNSSSPLYTGPFQLHSNAVVQARAFHSGYNPSAPSIASYKISAGAPTVQFVLSSDSGPVSATTCYPLLALSALPNEAVTVTYLVVDPSGKSKSGSATFFSGEVYYAFPLSLLSAGTSRITITGAKGAVVGPTRTFEYTMR